MSLDRPAMLRGAAVTLAIFWPVYGIVWLLRHNDLAFSESNLWVVAVVLALVVAPGAGGYVAGRAQPRTSMAHGAGAAGVGFAVTAAVAVIRAAVRGGVGWGGFITSLILFGVLFCSIGVIGGYLAFRRSVRAGTSAPPGR